MGSKSVKLWSFAVFLLLVASMSVNAESACPVTRGSDFPANPKMPGTQFWFGDSQLAAVIPEDGMWPTTQGGASISVKSLWWSSEFDTTKPPTLEVTISRLDGEASDAKVSRPSYVEFYSEEGVWDNNRLLVMVGLDFPSAGCWRVTGHFLDNEIEYVVETKSFEDVT